MTIWFKIVAPSCMSYEDDGNCFVACSEIFVYTQEINWMLWFNMCPGVCVCVCVSVYKSSHGLPVCVVCQSPFVPRKEIAPWPLVVTKESCFR